MAGGLGLAGTVAAGLPAPAAAAAGPRQDDLRVLGDLLGIERVLEYAYRRALRSWSFDSSAHAVLELILAHEVQHAAVLRQRMAELAAGLSPAAQGAARPVSSGSALSDVRTLFSQARTPRDAYRVLTKVESLAEARYFHAAGALQSADLALISAQILASEAQHWSLLLNVLNDGDMPQVVPNAFVRGVGALST